MEYLELSYIAVESVNWYNHFGKPAVSTKVGHTYIPNGPVVLLLGTYLTEMYLYVRQSTCINLLLTSISQNHPKLEITQILIISKLEKQTMYDIFIQ